MKLCTAGLTSSEYHYGAKHSAQVHALSLVNTIVIHMNMLTAAARGKSNQLLHEIGNDRQ